MKRGLLIGTGLFVLTLFAVASWLLISESGLRFAFSRLAAALPVEVTAGQVEGRIAGRMIFTGLRIRDGSFEAGAGECELVLSVWPLLAGEVAFRSVILSEVTIEPGASPPGEGGKEPSVFAMPEPALPFKLRSDEFVARGVSFQRSGKDPLIVDRLSASGVSFEGRRWRVERFDVDSVPLSGGGDLAYLSSAKHDFIMHFNGVAQLTDKKIKIQMVVEGDEESARVRQDLEGVLSGHVIATLNDLASARTWTATAELKSDDLSQIRPGLPESETRMSVQAQGQGSESRATGSLGLGAQPELDFAIELSTESGGVVVRQVELTERGGPARVAFSGQLLPSTEFPEIDGRLSWASLSWPLRRVDDEAPLLGTPSGEIAVLGSAGSYRLEGEATIRNDTAEGTLSTTGLLDLREEQPRFELQGAWDALTVRTAERSYVARQGRYSLGGLVSDYRFSGGFTLLGEGWPELDVSAAGRGDRERLTIERMEANSAAGRLSGRGTVGLAEDRPFKMTLLGKAVDPGAFVPGWPGSLDLEAGVSGFLRDGEMSAKLALEKLTGQLRGRRMSASGELGYAGKRLQITRLAANWADAELRAEGSLGTRMNFTWRIAIPDLALLATEGAGRLDSSGRLTGSTANPLLSAKLEGEGIVLGEYAAEQLRAEANIDFEDRDTSTLDATASGVMVSGTAISVVELQGGGRAGEHQASLRIKTDKAVVSTELTGALDTQGWRATVTRTRIALETGEWSQGAAAALRVTDSGWSLGRTCLEREPSSVCMSVESPRGGPPAFDLSLQALPLAELGLLLPEGLEYEGNVSGRARLQGLGRAPRGTATFEVSGGKVWQVMEDEQLVLVDFRSMNGEARLDGGRLDLQAVLRELDSPEVLVEASLPYENWQVGQGPVSGRIDGTLDSLGVLSVLFPDLADPQGRLETRLRLSGTVAAPAWDGYVELRDARASIPALGILIASLNARVDAGDDKLSLRGRALSGQGALELSGDLSTADGGIRGRVSLTGQDFLAADLPEARVVASPEIVLEIQGRLLRLEGDVLIPEARIAPRDLSGAIRRSPDEQIMRDDGMPAETEGWQLGSRVRMEFGDKVTFDGFGLEARITGAVTAIDEPGRVTTATGELQVVDGTYVAYGRRLEVRRGRLLFTGGPLSNPGLDILAVRKIEGGPEVGVVVRATLEEPELALYSDPSMQSAQTLSYLLVGQPLADVEGVDRQLVNDTAARLATAGGGFLAQQLGRRFGLGDVSVRSGATGESAALVIGKYLSPRLYASYGIGLFEPVNTLRLRYALSSKWNLRAESGLNQSLDLEYSLER